MFRYGNSSVDEMSGNSVVECPALALFGKGREGQTEDFQIAVLSAHATAPYTQRKERGTPKTSILSG